MPVKKTIIILIILAVAALGAVRAAQVISGKKKDEPAKRQAIPQNPLVEATPVALSLLEEKIIRTGDVAPNAQVTIFSKVQGWVERINVREGDRVATGQVLATLDSREAQAAVAQSKANLEAATARLKQVRATSQEAIQSQIQQTQATLDLAEADLKRATELHGKNFISRQQLDEARTKYNLARAAYDLAQNHLRQKTWENDIALAEAQEGQARATLDLTQAQMSNLVIRSPMNSLVTKRFVDPGTMIKDTTAILNLMDLSEVKMVVNVIEKEFVRLKKGQSVKISVTAFPGRIFAGRICAITPALELQSRTSEVQITIPNPGHVLNPGMFGRAEIILRSNPQAILVPTQAVLTQEGRNMVFVLNEGKAYRRPVQKGAAQDDLVEITQGLKPGEQVITAGMTFLLKDGLPVRLAGRPEKRLAN